MTQIDDYERRFTGVRTLYGDAFDKFTNAIVYVIGVGGVGSWTAESLARTAIGKIVLVDMDVLVASNINRQLPALTDTIGESKIDVMADRIRGINPKIELELVDDFLTPENVTTILPTKAQVQAWLADGKRVVVLDCVDDMAAKFAIAMHCRFNKIDCVISGGVGAKFDPTRLKVADLRDVTQDPLLARLRAKLREKGIAKGGKTKFGLKCVYSDEQPTVNKSCQAGLNCGGYGSAVVMTATAGVVMASTALQMIAKK